MNKKIVIIIIMFCGFSFTLLAQRDSTKKQTIDITSSYKPVLRNSVKINFSASNLPTDTSKILNLYNVPPQNLFYTYQSVSLKPLALTQDSSLDLGMRNYIKAGFGNLSTPYLSAGFSFGDGKTSMFNLYADYISSKGKIINQDYAQMNVKASGSYFTNRNEIFGSVGIKNQDYYLYGYDHALHNYNKADILQRFQDVSIQGGIRNKDKNETGINYSPNAQITVFSSQNKLTESSLVLEVPVEKTFGEVLSIKVAVKADVTSYTTKNLIPNNVKLNNNIFQISPELIYATNMIDIHAGVIPTWDNGKFTLLPNVYGEAQIKDNSFLVQAGLIGRFIKNTYRNLSTINPYLQPVSFQQNTKETELYGGIKKSVGKHFNFSAKAGLISYSNFALFINDTATDNKSFLISNESKLSDLRLHADMSFINQDKFTVTAGLTFNGYTGMKDNARAWGTIPLEMTASMRWWAFKQVMLKGDFKTFSGGAYLLKNNANGTLIGGTDLSAGAEFAINKNFSAWIDVNNILNNKYERWHNYQVYGLNILGGIIYKF